jgi:hypothetical protein
MKPGVRRPPLGDDDKDLVGHPLHLSECHVWAVEVLQDVRSEDGAEVTVAPLA